MHVGYRGFPLHYVRFDLHDEWRRLLTDRHPAARIRRFVGGGDVVQVVNISHALGDRWALVDTLHMLKRTPTPGNPRVCYRDYARGFLRLPADAPDAILRPIPTYRYFENVIPGGLPSHLAVGDTVVLVEGYPGPGEAVYTNVPGHESAPPNAGILAAADVARVIGGPLRTATGLLYWQVANVNAHPVNAHQTGYVREYTRIGSRVRFLIRPHIIGRR